LEDWGRFLAARSDQELEDAAMSNPVIAKAKGALDFLSEKPDVQWLAQQRKLAQINNFTEFQAGRAEGEARGRAAALLALLRARGLEVPEQVQARIQSCHDIAVLDGWIERAVTAACVDEVMEE
jgi:hypothetical protein